MANRLPFFLDRHKICIICEGNEEYKYLERLIALNVWNEAYQFSLENADGSGNIPARYQDKYQNGSYELVLIFCDTEKKPYEQYEDIKRKINEFHGKTEIANELIIFGNPCTMEIIIKHWTDEHLITPAKKKSAPIIEKFTGVPNYKAKAKQLDEIMQYVTVDNYADMCSRVKKIDISDTVIGSSNFSRFIAFFSSSDETWIDDINAKIEE